MFDICVILTLFHIWLNIIQSNWIYSQTKYPPPILANAAAKKNNVRETIVIVISATDICFFPFALHENNIWRRTSALLLHPLYQIYWRLLYVLLLQSFPSILLSFSIKWKKKKKKKKMRILLCFQIWEYMES